jgi:hypothetical protein
MEARQPERAAAVPFKTTASASQPAAVEMALRMMRMMRVLRANGRA